MTGININLESVLPVLISVAVTWGMVREKMKNMEKRDEEQEKKFLLKSVFEEQRQNNENAHRRIFETITKEEHERKAAETRNFDLLRDSISELKSKVDADNAEIKDRMGRLEHLMTARRVKA